MDEGNARRTASDVLADANANKPRVLVYSDALFPDADSARKAPGLASHLFAFASLMVSIGSFFIFVSSFFADANPFEIEMMGLFVLAFVAAFPIMRDPDNPIGALVQPLFRLLGVLCFFGGILMAPLWILGFAIILSKGGVGDEWFLASLLWLPVYFGLPAMMSGIGADKG